MYHSRTAFQADLNQIKENSLTYNGPHSKITHTAEQMILVGTKTLDEVGGACDDVILFHHTVIM